MNLEQIKNELYCFLKSQENFFFRDLSMDIAFTLDSIISDMYNIDKGLKTANTALIEMIVYGISDYVLNAAINEKTSKFIQTYLEVIFNWNKEVYKNNRLSTVILMTNKLIEVKNIMDESTTFMKDLIERNKDLGGWHPPVFEVAKEYFDHLLNKYESEEQGNNEETRCTTTE